MATANPEGRGGTSDPRVRTVLWRADQIGKTLRAAGYISDIERLYRSDMNQQQVADQLGPQLGVCSKFRSSLLEAVKRVIQEVIPEDERVERAKATWTNNFGDKDLTEKELSERNAKGGHAAHKIHGPLQPDMIWSDAERALLRDLLMDPQNAHTYGRYDGQPNYKRIEDLFNQRSPTQRSRNAILRMGPILLEEVEQAMQEVQK